MSSNDQNNQAPCCGGDNCCTPVTPGGKSSGSRWKSIAFLAVMVLAGVVAAYAWFLKDDAAAGGACCPGGSTTSAGECVPSSTMAVAATSEPKAPVTLFVLLEHVTAPPQSISDMLARVSDRVAVTGERPVTVLLFPIDPAFGRIADRHHITSFPTIVACSPTDSLVFPADQIREDSIGDFCERHSIAAAGCAAVQQTQTAANGK